LTARRTTAQHDSERTHCGGPSKFRKTSGLHRSALAARGDELAQNFGAAARSRR
jgi:hypothetical protein